MIYSKQHIYCNICGKSLYITYNKLIGRNCKVCSIECLNEFNWRDVLSNQGAEYYPSEEKNK